MICCFIYIVIDERFMPATVTESLRALQEKVATLSCYANSELVSGVI